MVVFMDVEMCVEAGRICSILDNLVCVACVALHVVLSVCPPNSIRLTGFMPDGLEFQAKNQRISICWTQGKDFTLPISHDCFVCLLFFVSMYDLVFTVNHLIIFKK